MPHEAPYLADTAAEAVRLNPAIKNAAPQSENLPKDLSNVVIGSRKGLVLAEIRILCCDSVAVTVPQLTHHRSAVIKVELQALLDDLHAEWGCAGNFQLPRRCLHRTQETCGSTVCSTRRERWGSVSSCRPRCAHACTPIYRKYNGTDGGGRPCPTASRIGTYVCYLGPARMWRCGP